MNLFCCRKTPTKTPETVKVTSWDELLEKKLELTTDGGWLFRGMQCSEWNLETSLERACTNHYGKNPSKAPEIENILTREFRRRYHNHRVGIPDPEGIEWLSLMQHYGAPTRLLDFTYSFFIAAYFAVEKPCQESCSHACKKSCSHAIWAVRNKWVEKGIDLLEKKGISFLLEKGVDIRYLRNEKKEQQWKLQKPFFESLLHLDVGDPNLGVHNPLCVFPVNAMRLNERSTIQRGVFLCAGNVTKSFVENLRKIPGWNLKRNLVKLELRFTHKERLEALERLHAMNIYRASLFPGLEGFAQSLAIHHPLI